MIACIQRVTQAQVEIKDYQPSRIEVGLLILVGIEEADKLDDIDWLARKITQLRIFDDSQGVMNLDVRDIGGEILVVSQFTLHASTKKGNRPSYIKAARPETAIPLYEEFVSNLEEKLGKPVKTGEFGAYMKISLINDGPVTILIDTKDKK